MRKLLLLFTWVSLVASHAEVLRDIPYAGKESRALQKLDLYLPDEKRAQLRPIFVLIHGGGWSIGDKGNSRFVEPKTSWLLEGGYMVASVNYRLAPAVKHPGQVEDVCKAIAWIQKHAAKHGGDPQRIYLLGHSAGAHLAALAAVDGERMEAAGANPAGIHGVILLDGAGYDIPIQYSNLRDDSPLKKMYRNAFTNDPVKQRDASPVHRVTAQPPPFLILCVASRRDSRHQSLLLAEALRGKNGLVKMVPMAGKNHGTISADCGKEGDPVTLALQGFLRPE